MTVIQKGMILVIVPLLCQLTFVVLLVYFQSERNSAEEWAQHSNEVIASAQNIQSVVTKIRDGVGGNLIRENPVTSNSLQTSRLLLTQSLDELDRLVHDNSDQSRLSRQVRESSIAFLDWLHDVDQLFRDGKRAEAINRLRSDQGKQRQEEFLGAISQFLLEEEQLERNRVGRIKVTRKRLNQIVIGGGILAIGTTVILAAVFYRGIAHRFRMLESNIQRLADRTTIPPPLEGNDELARLDRRFREMAERLLEVSEAARDLFDNAPCGYHVLDSQGNYVSVNQTELAWLGYREEEIVEKKAFRDLLTTESQERFRPRFEQFRNEGTIRDLELEMRRADGSTIPIMLNATAVFGEDGGFLRSRSTLMDMSDRKRSEAAVRLFADLAHNLPIGLLVYQLTGTGEDQMLRVVSANRSAESLLGISLAHSAGLPVREVFPEIPDEQVRRYSAVALTGHVDDFGEFRYGDDRVRERWWAVLAFPLPDRSVGIVFQDVTARKNAETEVRRLNDELESRVQTRTAELELVNRELAHKNAENEMFVYSVSHDLRSPLVNLQGFSRELGKCKELLGKLFDDTAVPTSLRDQGQSIVTGKMTKSIDFILSAVLRLSGIIDALLRLSRAGRIEYRWQVVDVNSVLHQVIDAAHGTIEERGAVVNHGDLPPAWGDRTAIEQVFGNLVENALRYLAPARPGVITIGYEPEISDGFRTYFVRDNGLGIAEGHREKIFLAFQRAHPGHGSGEGLGLAIASRVIERHHGRIWVETCVDQGSTFFFTLPVPPERSDESLT